MLTKGKKKPNKQTNRYQGPDAYTCLSTQQGNEVKGHVQTSNPNLANGCNLGT